MPFNPRTVRPGTMTVMQTDSNGRLCPPCFGPQRPGGPVPSPYFRSSGNPRRRFRRLGDWNRRTDRALEDWSATVSGGRPEPPTGPLTTRTRQATRHVVVGQVVAWGGGEKGRDGKHKRLVPHRAPVSITHTSRAIQGPSRWTPDIPQIRPRFPPGTERKLHPPRRAEATFARPPVHHTQLPMFMWG